MKDPRELLQQKEADLARVRHEVESLRIVTPLLTDEMPSVEPDQKRPSLSADPDPDPDSIATGTNGLFSSAEGPRRPFWKALKLQK